MGRGRIGWEETRRSIRANRTKMSLSASVSAFCNCIQKFFDSFFFFFFCKIEREREGKIDAASVQLVIALASLSGLIRGRRDHKGMPGETPMSRRREAVKGRSKRAFSKRASSLARAFSALNANNAITTAVR